MKFVVDAHLPRQLAYRLREMGYDTLHTLDLPNGNRTTDAEINRIAEQEQRIVVTKDADFVSSFIVTRKPYKLLLVSTGNISNPELEITRAYLMPHVRAGSGTGVPAVGAIELVGAGAPSEADGVAQPGGIDLATAAVGARAQQRRAAEVPLLAGVATGADRDV